MLSIVKKIIMMIACLMVCLLVLNCTSTKRGVPAVLEDPAPTTTIPDAPATDDDDSSAPRDMTDGC